MSDSHILSVASLNFFPSVSIVALDKKFPTWKAYPWAEPEAMRFRGSSDSNSLPPNLPLQKGLYSKNDS
ncbi:hypothetical protein AVEN_62525-1, partial [Araneus ventricosus]